MSHHLSQLPCLHRASNPTSDWLSPRPALIGRIFFPWTLYSCARKRRERCAHIFDIKADGLAVKRFQMLSHAITIVAHKDVLLGLVPINIISNTKVKGFKPTVGR